MIRGRAIGLIAAALALTAAPALARCTQGDGAWIARACYDAPLTEGRYGHDVLGGTPEWTTLRIERGPLGQKNLTEEVETLHLGQGHIFEDLAPRIVQLDGSGPPELVVIDTAFDRGAALMVVNLGTGRVASTPYIGQSFRWLAPLGAADLDGDGRAELAYVDRPHLAKALLIWRYDDDGKLSFVTRADDLTNHRIGDDYITGGIRNCGEGPEVVLVDSDWRTIMAARLENDTLSVRELGPYAGPVSVQERLSCLS